MKSLFFLASLLLIASALPAKKWGRARPNTPSPPAGDVALDLGFENPQLEGKIEDAYQYLGELKRQIAKLMAKALENSNGHTTVGGEEEKKTDEEGRMPLNNKLRRMLFRP